MEARALLAAVRRFWWLVLALTVIGALAGFGASQLRPVTYRSTASLSVSAPDLSIVSGGVSGGTSAAYVATQVGVLESDSVMRKAAQRAGVSLQQIERSTHVEQRDTSNIIDITTSSTRPRVAQRMAQGIANEYLQRQNGSSVLQSSEQSLRDRMATLQTQIRDASSARVAASLQSQYNQLAQQLAQVQLATQLGSGSSATLISKPTVPWSPVPRHGPLYALGGLFCGLAVAVLSALLLSLRFPVFRTARQVEDGLGIPIAVDLPRVPGAEGTEGYGELALRSPKLSGQLDALVAVIAGATDEGEFGPQQVAVATLTADVRTEPLTAELSARFGAAERETQVIARSAAEGATEQGALLTRTEVGPASADTTASPAGAVVFNDLGRLLDRPETVLAARTADVLILVVALPLRDGRLLQTTLGSTLRQDRGRILVVTTRPSKVGADRPSSGSAS